MTENKILYNDPDQIITNLKGNIAEYFINILGSKKTEIERKIISWEAEIEKAIQEFNTSFAKEKWSIYEKMPNVFKDNVFPKLWTVGAALRNPDPDLINYRVRYKNISPRDLFNSFKNIYSKSEEYVNTYGRQIDFNKIDKIEDLKQDFFSEEDMILTGVIGFGVRSEFLFKAFPSIFSLMTRRSHWSMYFITNSEEFIFMEKGWGKYNGSFRYSNQFTYEYDRFNYYSNVITNMLIEYLNTFEIRIKNDLRFGYINYFISECFDKNKDVYEALHEWREI
jgi:hypothetical protein